MIQGGFSIIEWFTALCAIENLVLFEMVTIFTISNLGHEGTAIRPLAALPYKAVQFYTSVFMTICIFITCVGSSYYGTWTVLRRILPVERASKSWAIIRLV